MAQKPGSKSDPSLLCTRNPRMWMLRASMFLAVVGMGITWTYAGPWMKENGLGETVIGSIAGGGALLFAGMGMLWGWLSDRTGRTTWFAAFGAVLAGSSLLVLSNSSSVGDFILFQLLSAVGLSALLTLVPVLAMTVLRENGSTDGYGNFRVFGAVGYLFALFFLAMFVQGLPSLFLVCGVLACLACVPVLLSRIAPERHGGKGGFGAVLRKKRVCVILLAFFFCHLAMPAMFMFTTIYAKVEMGMDQSGVAMLGGVCGVTATFGLPLMAVAAKRMGARTILLISFAAVPLRLIAIMLSPGPMSLYATQLFHLLTWAGPEAVVYFYMASLIGRKQSGVAVSAYMFVQTIGRVIGNPVAGYLAEHIGFRPMFLAMAGVSVLGLLLFVVASKGADREQAAEVPEETG